MKTGITSVFDMLACYQLCIESRNYGEKLLAEIYI